MAAPTPSGEAKGERLRILHVASPAEVGGLERVVQALAIGHHRRGHDVHVVTVLGSRERDHPFLPPLRKAGVPVHLLALPGRAYLAERRAIRRLVDELAPDVFHSHSERTDVLDAPVARRRGVPTVTTIHGASFQGGRATLYEWLQRRSYRRFDAVIAVSRALYEHTLEGRLCRAERLHLVPNAWDGCEPDRSREEARRDLGLPETGAVVGFVGRLIRVKGGDVFVEALARLADLPLRAAVVGDGPERPRLEARVAELGLAGRVRFVGRREYAFRDLRAFDALALSSRSEGTPILLLETVAAGVPVVASRVGGVEDVVGEDGALLVPAEDPEALALALRAVLGDPEAAARRARSARARLGREYGVETWLDRHEEIYARLRRG